MIRIFLLGIFIIVFIYTVFGLVLISQSDFSTEECRSMLCSGFIATMNIMSGFFLLVKANSMNHNTFIRFFLVATAIRFFVLLGVIAVTYVTIKMDHFTFLVSLFILYFLFQFWEIFVFNKFMKTGFKN